MRTLIVSGVIAAVIALILFLGAGDVGGPNAYIVIGVYSGAAYGVVALGLVLVYKGARVFNFAAGEFGTMAAFIMFVLLEQVRSPEIPYGVAVVIALLGVTLLGLGMERVVVRPLLNQPRVTLLVATIAFALLLIGIELLLFLPEVKTLQPILQTTSETTGQPTGWTIFDYTIPPQGLLLMGILAALGAGLAYFFSRTDLGLAVLATSQDAFATRVVGIGVERMSRFIWGASAFLGAVAGILYVPLQGGLAPGVITQQTLIPAFTAAVLGGMTSLPGAFIGGVVIGVVQQLAIWASGAYHLGDRFVQEVIPAFADVSVIILLLIVLLARPQGLLGSEA